MLGVGVWWLGAEVWSGPGLVWMRGGVSAAAQLWGARLLAAGNQSSIAICRCWLGGSLRAVSGGLEMLNAAEAAMVLFQT